MHPIGNHSGSIRTSTHNFQIVAFDAFKIVPNEKFNFAKEKKTPKNRNPIK